MTRMRWVAAGAAVVAVVAGIGAGIHDSGDGDNDESTTSDGSIGAAFEESSAGGSATDAAVGDEPMEGAALTGSQRSSTASLILDSAAVIRTGSLTLSTPNLEQASADIGTLLSSLDGYLASENTMAADDGRIRSAALVLKVPSDRFDVAMQRLGDVGDVLSRNVSAKDVTREVADVDSRVSSARAALERIRLLLDRANSLGTVIRLESVLSDRQAELESLLAQQKALASQTQLATIDVSLSVPSRTAKVEPESDERGFVAGLRHGWDAFTTMISGIATAIGALLPFSVLLTLLGVPAWLLTRRFRTGRAHTG